MPMIETNEIRMYYELEGEGEPLVLIMGLGSGHQMWEDNVPGFARHCRVLTFDNRGVGKTEKPAEDYSIELFAEDTASLLQELNMAPAHVIGASMGGAIAQELAIAHPDLVKSLILVCTWPGKDRYFTRILENWQLMAQHISVSEMNRTNIVWGVTPRFFEENYEELEKLHASVLEDEQPAEAYVRQNLACQAFDARDRLHLITAPTLVLVGDADILTPVRFARELHDQIPRASLTILDGEPHAMMWESPARFNEVCLRFLRQHAEIEAT